MRIVLILLGVLGLVAGLYILGFSSKLVRLVVSVISIALIVVGKKRLS